MFPNNNATKSNSNNAIEPQLIAPMIINTHAILSMIFMLFPPFTVFLYYFNPFSFHLYNNLNFLFFYDNFNKKGNWGRTHFSRFAVPNFPF